MFMVSISVSADWSELGSPSSGRYKSYVDYNSITKDGGNISFWMLTDWKEVKESSGDRRLSDIQHIKLDCKARTMTLLDFVWYSKNMGLGSIVYSQSNIKTKPISVVPMTGDEHILKALCVKYNK